jgi:hypothetical protein
VADAAAAIVHHVSDGGMAAEHGRRRLPLVVAPTVDADLNTIGLPLPPIACFRVDDPRFQRCLLLR